MNTINFCRNVVPVLPDSITRELLVVQMLTLEQHLRATNPVFEANLFMAITGKLAEIYNQVNHFPGTRRMVVESKVFEHLWVAPKRREKYNTIPIN